MRNTVLATEAVRRIAALYAVERDIRGRPPDERARERQARAGPLIEAMHAWLTATLARVPGRGDLAGAIRYALSRWAALGRYLGDGRLEIDNNPVERAIRPLALGRNYAQRRIMRSPASRCRAGQEPVGSLAGRSAESYT